MPDGFYRCRFCGEDLDVELGVQNASWDEIVCDRCGKSTLYLKRDRETHRFRKDDVHGV